MVNPSLSRSLLPPVKPQGTQALHWVPAASLQRLVVDAPPLVYTRAVTGGRDAPVGSMAVQLPHAASDVMLPPPALSWLLGRRIR